MALSDAIIGGLFGLGSTALSAGGNMITSAVNSSRAWKYTQRAMMLQDELNRKYHQWSTEFDNLNIPSLARKGYTNAGYNPLLAIGQSYQGGSAMPSATFGQSDSDNGAQAVENGINSATALLNLKNLQKQGNNIDADTDIKKYGQKGAILKNLVELSSKTNNPKVQKVVNAQISKELPDYSNSAVDNLRRYHPTTYRVLLKLKNGDFKGAHYEIMSRRQRIINELNKSTSAVSSKKHYDTVTSWNNKDKKFLVEYLDENKLK